MITLPKRMSGRVYVAKNIHSEYVRAYRSNGKYVVSLVFGFGIPLPNTVKSFSKKKSAEAYANRLAQQNEMKAC